MQPTEHKQKKDEELIAHIKHSLKTHEELYQLGAWEKFNEMQQTKKRPIFWLARVSGVAAILAICFTLIWYTTNNPQKEQLTQEKGIKESSSPENLPVTEPELSLLANEQLAMKDTKHRALEHERVAVPKQTEVVFAKQETKPNAQVAVEVDPLAGSKDQIMVSPQVKDQQVIAQVVEKDKPDILDFLANETQKGEGKLDKLAVNSKQKKWDFGLMLAPSFGDTKELNMGYGLSMTYNFSDRLSLSSGIAYNKMNTSKNLPTTIGLSSVVLGNTRSLEMISEEVTGIDIPLELKYHINKNVYANLGVSGLAVLNQSRKNTFVETVVIKKPSNTTSSIGGANGSLSSANGLEDQKGQFANAYLVNQRTTENASAAIEDVNYIGFYNFSFGYTKKVYKNHALSIEPFVKLPIKMVTQDNLRLVGTGVRLKVGF